MTNKFTLHVDTGTRIDLGKSDLSFKDAAGNIILDTELGNHAFSMPKLSYSFSIQLGIF